MNWISPAAAFDDCKTGRLRIRAAQGSAVDTGARGPV